MRNSKLRLAVQSEFRFATRIIDKLCAQHKAFFMPVSLVLIGVVSVREVKPRSVDDDE